MPHLQRLYQNRNGSGLEILSVNQAEPAAVVGDFIRSRNYTFHVLLDEDRSIAEKYGVPAIPTLILIDRRGLVRWIQVGFDEQSEKSLRKLVERLLKE